MAATRQNVTIPLYQESLLDLTQATTDVSNCRAIENSITLLSSAALIPAEIQIVVGPLVSGSIGSKLAVDPTNLKNTGEYIIQMTSCITYGDGTYKVCAKGTPFKITIVDPCVTTRIVSGIFDRVMARPQLQSDTLNLSDEIAIGRWPWAVQLDYEVGPSYKRPICGPIAYQVLTKEAIPQVQDLVTLNGNVLTFAPQLKHTPGNYDLILVGTLIDYPFIQHTELFQVQVLPCVATINFNAAQQTLLDQYRYWGDSAYTYNIQNTIQAYTQSPNCGYEMTYAIWYENVYS